MEDNSNKPVTKWVLKQHEAAEKDGVERGEVADDTLRMRQQHRATVKKQPIYNGMYNKEHHLQDIR